MNVLPCRLVPGLMVIWQLLGAQYVTPKYGWYNFFTPFPDTFVNATHIGRFTLDPPAGHHGRIIVHPDGHLYFADNSRIKFFGTNVCFDAVYPQNSTAVNAARHVAKQGFNIVRYHHLDGALTSAPGSNSSRRLNQQVLDRFDYYFARLKEQGIYSALDLYSIRYLKSGDGIPQWDSVNRSMTTVKRVYMFYPPAYALFRDYPDSLLSHFNPYTGLAYKDDPALVFINPINEGTLLDHYFWTEWDDPASEYYLPRFYKSELQHQWNDWLYNKYHWDTTLVHAWSGDTGTGPNLISNGEFSDTVSSHPRYWFFNQFSGAATWGVQNAGLSLEPAVYVNITQTAQYTWHIQLGQGGMRICMDSTYWLKFKVKASHNRSFDVVIQRNRTPWTTYFYQTINALTTGQDFDLPFYCSTTDTVQLTFNLGGDTGRIWIDDVQLMRAPFIQILDPGESLMTRTIKLVSWNNRFQYSPYRIFDQIRFFLDQEADFYHRITALLIDTLQVHGLITSSYFWSSQLHQKSWSGLVSVMDGHPYYDHPNFPNRPWDTLDFRITNEYFGEGDHGEWMFTGVNQCASLNKPMIMTEWQHASPSESRYVTLIPFAGYAALRGYDGMINFALAHAENSYGINRIRQFFDSSGQPIHWVFLRMAGLAFLRDIETEDPIRTDWLSYDVETILRDIYAGNYWARAVTSTPRDRIFRQFTWNSTRGIFILNSRGSKAFAGRIAADTAWLGGIRVIGHSDGIFAASRLDSSWSSSTYLVAALARTENTGMTWRESSKTQGLISWGSSPCQAESISISTLWRADSLRISRLDNYGNPISTLTIPGTSNQTNWLIRTGLDSVPWYTVTAFNYLDTLIGVIEKNGTNIKRLNTIYSFCQNGISYFINIPAGAEIMIYAVDGRQVYEDENILSTPAYQVRGLAQGVYFYQISKEQEQVKGKLIVIR